MKRKLSDSNDFAPYKRRKIDPEVEKPLIDELILDINTDEVCTADEETLLVSDDETQLKQLIDRLPDLNHRFGYVKQTPLMIMIENGMTELAKYLIQEKKVDLGVADDNSQTALHYACENGNDDVACIIIDLKKQDLDYLDQSDGDALTPLIHAVQNSCVKAVAQLIRHKVTWNYKYDEDRKSFSVVLEANDKEVLKQFQGDPSKYWDFVEKKRNELVYRAVESGNIELVKEFLPQYSLDNYFNCNDDSGEVDSWDEAEEESGNILAEVITTGDEELIRYLHDRKAWFRDLAHVAVDTDDKDIVELMQEYDDLTGSRKSMSKALDAAVENENYEMLEYLLDEAGLGEALIIEEGKLSLEVALLVPESSSFARLLLKHNAELPMATDRYSMNPFMQDFYDRYSRSHVFGPKIEWWSPEEATFARDFNQSRFKSNEGAEDSECHFTNCSKDSMRQIFTYLNCIEDISSVMLTCKQFNAVISSQEYWKAQWFATYELAVIDESDEIDWKKLFDTMVQIVQKLLASRTGSGRSEKRWIFEEECRVARVCVLEGSYCYQVKAQDGTTSTRTITPNPKEPLSHFITCGVNEEINFDVEQSPLPMNKVKEFLPSGHIELVDYPEDLEEDDEEEDDEESDN